MNSIDLVLSAIDSTRPAIDSAISGFTDLSQTVADVGEQMAGSFAVSIDTSSVSTPLSALANVAAIATAAIAGVSLAVGGLALLVPAVSASLAAAVGWVATEFFSLGEGVSETIGSMIAGTFDWSGAFTNAGQAILTGFAIVETYVKSFGTAWDFLTTGLSLRVVQFQEDLGHTLTVVIPGLLTWTRDNWHDIWTTMLDFVATVIANATANLNSFFEAINNWMSGDGFDFHWQSLTEGFESSIKELPNIAARQIGSVEGELAEKYTKLGGDLGKAYTDGLNENISKRVAQLPDIVKVVKNAIGSVRDTLKKLLPDFDLSSLGALVDGGAKGKDKDRPTALPNLTSERFTTGVGDAGKQDAMIGAITEVKTAVRETITVLEKLLGVKLPESIKNAADKIAKNVGGGIPFGGR